MEQIESRGCGPQACQSSSLRPRRQARCHRVLFVLLCFVLALAQFLLLFLPFGMGCVSCAIYWKYVTGYFYFIGDSELRIGFESYQRPWPFEQFGAVKTLKPLEIVLIAFSAMTQPG